MYVRTYVCMYLFSVSLSLIYIYIYIFLFSYIITYVHMSRHMCPLLHSLPSKAGFSSEKSKALTRGLFSTSHVGRIVHGFTASAVQGFGFGVSGFLGIGL